MSPRQATPDDHRRDTFCFILFSELSECGRIERFKLHKAVRHYINELVEHGVTGLDFFFAAVDGLSRRVDEAIWEAELIGIVEQPIGYTSRLSIAQNSESVLYRHLKQQTYLTPEEVEIAKRCGAQTLSALMSGKLDSTTTE